MHKGRRGKLKPQPIAKWCVQNHGHMATGVAKRLTSTIEKRERQAAKKDCQSRLLD